MVESAEALMDHAVAHHQNGDLGAALSAYNGILAAHPDFHPAFNMKGVCLYQMGNTADALQCLRMSVALQPGYVAGLCNLGNVLSDCGDIAGAVGAFSKAAVLDPDSAAIQTNLGLSLLETGQTPEAVCALERAVQLEPDNAQAKNNLGNALKQQGHGTQALAMYRSAWESQGLVDAGINLSTTLKEQGLLDDAHAIAAQVCQLHPGHATAWKALGLVQQERGQAAQAAAALGKALELGDRAVETYYWMAILLSEVQEPERALPVIDAGLALHAHSSDLISAKMALLLKLARNREVLELGAHAHANGLTNAHILQNTASALSNLGRVDEAIACYEQLLTLDPGFIKGWHSLGAIYSVRMHYEQALECFKKAYALDPDYPFLLGTMLLTGTYLCDWGLIDRYLGTFKADLEAGKETAPPFATLALLDDPALQARSAAAWVTDVVPLTNPATLKPAENGKIKIGYFSADYHNHATAYLLAELIELHDRSQFEIIGFSFGKDHQDGMRQRLVRAFDAFIDVREMSEKQIAARARDMGIHIAVDLKGHTGESRPKIFMHRAAPVQVNYLGHPGTMGLDCMDYIIADGVICPPDQRAHYAEKVVTLPHSYQVNDSQRAIASMACTRAQAGLPDQAFVYCCFNNNFKILPETFDAWMHILRAVDNSVLWLLEDNATAARNLKAAAAQRGIDPQRLIFARRAPLAEHLARHTLADLFLDTLPCNAHTTTSDALWAGLPVLTLAGRSFPARVAASLLHAVNLPELVTHNRADYEHLAIALARNPDHLAALKASLRKVKTTPLFDVPSFTRGIENAYRQMFDRAAGGLPPDHLCVPSQA